MKDLTHGSVALNIIVMAVPIMAAMLLQTLYYVVDLYFVSQLGGTAIAGVGSAGSLMFLMVALTQTLGAGVVALISQAVGRKDRYEASLVLNQSLVLAGSCAALTLVAGYAGAPLYMRAMSADPASAAAGVSYLYWFMPGIALQFVMVSIVSALSGSGIVRPAMAVRALTVLINLVLAPILIAGWGTGRALGVAGAGLASSLAIGAGVVLLSIYLLRHEQYMSLKASMWMPRPKEWARVLKIGLPAGGEFASMFVYFALIFWVTRHFGADAQAGFAVGSRVMQSIFLPTIAVALAVAPVVGQNFGAQKFARVRAAFRSALGMSCLMMIILWFICQCSAEWFVGVFSDRQPVIDVGAEFLKIIAWNFVGSGIVFTCSGTLQGLGHTLPSLFSSVSRLVTFAVPAVWFVHQPGFTLRHLWFLSIGSLCLQALTSLLLVGREFRLRLAGDRAGPASREAAASREEAASREYSGIEASMPSVQTPSAGR